MSAFAGLGPEELARAQRRFDSVCERIERAADRAGRPATEITLVGVAKRQPRERLLAALVAGVRVIGQSYVQEARSVRPAIEEALAADPQAPVAPGELEWRLVGRLQRNKAGLAARLFEAVESVDRPELADALARRAEGEGRVLEVLIQLSLCNEPQKGGCEPEALMPLAERILEAPGLRLRALREDLAGLDPSLSSAELSMGMSADLEVAVEEGATLVRIGTALFGERTAPKA
jgi:uncharacterized pyridoxal phosphate-containing UPF0001 family protein